MNTQYLNLSGCFCSCQGLCERLRVALFNLKNKDCNYINKVSAKDVVTVELGMLNSLWIKVEINSWK